MFGVVGVDAAVAGDADEGGRGAVRGGRGGDHALLQHGTGRVPEQVPERAGFCVWERGARTAAHQARRELLPGGVRGAGKIP